MVKKIKSLLTKDLLLILIMSGIFRLVYYSCLSITVTPDTLSYVDYQTNIFCGQINPFRTPVYPYFIKLIRVLFGQKYLYNNIVIAQCVISFLSIINVYYIAKILFKTRLVIILVSLLFGLMIPFINYDKLIMTESLSISFVILFTCYLINYYKKPTKSKAFLVSIFLFLLIMLRPSFVAFLPPFVLYWFISLYYNHNKKMALFGISGSFLVMLLILLYSSLNFKQNGFNGISTVSNINQLDNVINAKIFKAGGDPELIKSISDELTKPENAIVHWSLLETINKTYDPTRISKYIFHCIKNEPFSYFKNILNTVINISSESIFKNYAIEKKNIISSVFYRLCKCFYIFNFSFIYMFIIINVIYVSLNLRKIIKTKSFTFILIVIIIFHFLVSIVGAQADYGRLLMPVIPLCMFYLFILIDRFYFSINKKTFSSYQNI